MQFQACLPNSTRHELLTGFKFAFQMILTFVQMSLCITYKYKNILEKVNFFSRRAGTLGTRFLTNCAEKEGLGLLLSLDYWFQLHFRYQVIWFSSFRLFACGNKLGKDMTNGAWLRVGDFYLSFHWYVLLFKKHLFKIKPISQRGQHRN